MTLPKLLLIPLALLALVTVALVAASRDEPVVLADAPAREDVAVLETPAPVPPALPAPEVADRLEATRLDAPFDEPVEPMADPFAVDEPANPSSSGTIVLTIHDPSAFLDSGVRRGGFTVDEDPSWEQAWLAEWPTGPSGDTREPRMSPPPREDGAGEFGPARRGPPPGPGPAGRGAGARGGGGRAGGGGQGAGGGGCSR